MSKSLVDVADIIMGQSPVGDMCNDNGAGVPLLNGPTEFGVEHPFPVQFTTDPRKLAQKGDLLFCVRGSTTGRMNWSDQTYAIGRGIAAIRHKKNLNLQPLVRAVIECQLANILQAATGSTFPNVSRDQLMRIPFPNIDEDTELRIAELLSSLERKIFLNHRINDTLEAMAKAIFKDWFIDFGPTRAKMEGKAPYLAPEIWSLFPDRLNDDVPDGWTVSTIGSEYSAIMGQSPPGDTYNENGEGVPFYQGRTDFGSRYPKRRMYCSAPARMAKADDTLISVRAPVGDLNLAWEECCIGRGVGAIRHKSGYRGYTYYSMMSVQGELAAFEHTGTVFGAVNKAQLEAIRVIAPPTNLISLFEANVSGMDDKIRQNVDENSTLTELRDFLLPRLMSGEIRLKDAEKAVEAVM